MSRPVHIKARPAVNGYDSPKQRSDPITTHYRKKCFSITIKHLNVQFIYVFLIKPISNTTTCVDKICSARNNMLVVMVIIQYFNGTFACQVKDNFPSFSADRRQVRINK